MPHHCTHGSAQCLRLEHLTESDLKGVLVITVVPDQHIAPYCQAAVVAEPFGRTQANTTVVGGLRGCLAAEDIARRTDGGRRDRGTGVVELAVPSQPQITGQGVAQLYRRRQTEL